MLLGANDLTNESLNVATWLSDFAAYCDARRAAGWKVVAATILPSTNASVTAKRGTVNTALRSWVGVHADAIADFAADATMGPDAAASDTTYYADGVHPTAAGHALLEPIMTAAINGL